MSFNKAILKVQLNELSKKDLVDAVLKLAKKRSNYAFILTNYIDTEDGQQTLFDETLQDIEKLNFKAFPGRTLQHQQAKNLSACLKKVNEFSADVKNHKLEVDLIIYVLDAQFSNPVRILGAKISTYDYKMALLIKRLITLVTNKLHVDYFADYEEKINEFLVLIHKYGSKISTIKELPKSI